MATLLVAYLVLRLAQQVAETALAVANRRYALDPARLAAAARALAIPDDDMRQAVAYSADRHRFGLVSGWTDVVIALAFVAAGGLGLLERWATAASAPVGGGPIATGLAFFALLGVAGGLVSLPFELYSTFVIEERHGFNRQTLRGFVLDRVKGAALAVALGGLLLAGLLWVMERMGAVLVAVGVGARGRLQPARGVDLPESPRAAVQPLHAAAGGGAARGHPRPREAHGLPRGRRVRDGRVAAHGPRQRLLHRALRPEADRALRHPRRGAGRARGDRGARPRARSLQAAPRALGDRPQRRRERRAVLPAQPGAAGERLLRGVLAATDRLRRARRLRPVVLARRLPAAAARERAVTPPRVRRRRVRRARTARARPSSARRCASCGRRAGSCPSSHPLYSRVYHSHPPLVERLRAMGALWLLAVIARRPGGRRGAP